MSERSDVLERFVGVIMYLALPFSGAFVMVDWVLQSFQPILLWIPFVNGQEMIRQGQFGPQVTAHYDFINT